MEGYFDYVVPPLEGLWWQERDRTGLDHAAQGSALHGFPCIRLPEFVTREVFLLGRAGGLREERAAGFLRGGVLPLGGGGCACSACTWVPTTDEGATVASHGGLRRGAGVRPGLRPQAGSTMRSTWAIPGGASRKTSKPCCGTPYENYPRNKGAISMLPPGSNKKVREDTTSLTFLYRTAWQVAASAFLRMRPRQRPARLHRFSAAASRSPYSACPKSLGCRKASCISSGTAGNSSSPRTKRASWRSAAEARRGCRSAKGKRSGN